MTRDVENVQRITYTITEAEVHRLIRLHACEIPIEGSQAPVFHNDAQIIRIDGGGYKIINEYQINPA